MARKGRGTSMRAQCILGVLSEYRKRGRVRGYISPLHALPICSWKETAADALRLACPPWAAPWRWSHLIFAEFSCSTWGGGGWVLIWAGSFTCSWNEYTSALGWALGWASASLGGLQHLLAKGWNNWVTLDLTEGCTVWFMLMKGVCQNCGTVQHFRRVAPMLCIFSQCCAVLHCSRVLNKAVVHF